MKISRVFWIILILVMAVAPAFAQESPRYPFSETVRVADLLDAPGETFGKIYFQAGEADSLLGDDGEALEVGDFNAGYSAAALRILHCTEYLFLGGRVSADLIIPYFFRMEMAMEKAGVIMTPTGPFVFGVEDERNGRIGDVWANLYTTWYGQEGNQFTFGIAAFAPTGTHDEDRLVNPGRGYWSGMLGMGGTYRLPGDVYASGVARWEQHEGGENHFSVESSLTRPIGEFLELGLIGNAWWENSLDADTEDARNFALGPGLRVKPFGIPIDFKMMWNLDGKNVTEGWNLTASAVVARF